MGGRVVASVLVVVLSLLGCETDPGWTGVVIAPDQQRFEDEVYPILLRDCAFSECHGDGQRFFHVVGPGRTRLDGSPSDPELVRRERALSYTRTVSMLTTDPGQPITESLLFRKPLAVRAGGVIHKGVDAYGHDAFQGQEDWRYATILGWALGLQPSGSGASAVTAAQDTVAPVAGGAP